MGAVYAASLLIGIMMSTTVQPMIGTERAVFYREKASGMYSAVPYAVSQVYPQNCLSTHKNCQSKYNFEILSFHKFLTIFLLPLCRF